MWILATIAHGAGLDADGGSLPVQDGSVGHASLFGSAPRLEQRQLAIGLRTALALSPLVRQGDPGEPEVLVPSTGTAYLQGVGMLTSWLGASLHLPARLLGPPGAGPAVGDIRAAALVRVLHTPTVTVATDLGLQLPTGSVDRYAGAGRWIPHLGFNGTLHTGPLRFDAQADLAHEGALDAPRARGGLAVGAGIGVAVVSSRLGVGIAARTDVPLSPAIQARRGVGAELGVHADYRLMPRVQLNAIASHALTPAAGVPVWRFGVGGTAVIGKSSEPPPTPVAAAPATLRFVDPNGMAVPGARITTHDGDEVVADARGEVLAEGIGRGAIVSASGLLATRVRQKDGEVVLPWAPTKLVVEVSTETGAPVAAQVSSPGVEFVVQSASSQALVPPGTYEVTIAAPGFGSQTRTVEIAPRRTAVAEIEVVLAAVRGDGSLKLSVLDPQGVAIEGAEVRVDGVALGTSTSGDLGLDGLPRQRVDVEVDAPYFEDFRGSVDLAPGPGMLSIRPYYAAGTVRVVAEGPTGPIVDGTIFLDGPRTQPAVPLSPLGERLIRLTEGTWDLMLSSPAHGLQERRVVLDEDSPVPVDVWFALGGQLSGNADLVVRLRDRDGRALPGVTVQIDGVVVGTTSTDGSLKLLALPEGVVQVSAQGPALREVDRAVELREGAQEITLSMDWDPGSVQVRAQTPDGPADALILFDGPTDFEGGRLGPPGRRLFQEVPSGRWELVASHEAGMEVAVTVVEDDDPHLVEVDLHLGREVGDASLDLTLVNPDGTPVSGARVAIDGVELATTSTGGGLRVNGLVAGQRTLSITSPLHEPKQVQVDLPGTPLRMTLPYRVGVVELQVTSAGIPVDDASVFFDGPTPVDAVALGSDGAARIHLGPGQWTLMVSSPAYGLAEQTVALSANQRVPTPVDVDLTSREPLLVRVMDGRGAPIAGVRVQVDGVDAGQTSSTGAVVVGRSGEVTVTLQDERLLETPARVTPEAASEQLFEVTWRPRAVPIRVTADGRTTDAVIQAIGPASIDAVRTSNGQGTIALPPGSWQLLATAEGFGVGRVLLEVPTHSPLDEVVFELRDAQVVVGAEAITLKSVLFGLDQATPTQAYDAVLDEVAATIIADPSILAVEIQGHTDGTGGPAYNFQLSRRRASSVLDGLVDRGVPADMLTARGFGQIHPLAPNTTEQGRAQNRRVHFQITKGDAAR